MKIFSHFGPRCSQSHVRRDVVDPYRYTHTTSPLASVGARRHTAWAMAAGAAFAPRTLSSGRDARVRPIAFCAQCNANVPYIYSRHTTRQQASSLEGQPRSTLYTVHVLYTVVSARACTLSALARARLYLTLRVPEPVYRTEDNILPASAYGPTGRCHASQLVRALSLPRQNAQRCTATCRAGS